MWRGRGWGQNPKKEAEWHVALMLSKITWGPGVSSGKQVLHLLGPCECEGLKPADEETASPFPTFSVFKEWPLCFPVVNEIIIGEVWRKITTLYYMLSMCLCFAKYFRGKRFFNPPNIPLQ